jgi:hypothetical protein
MKCIVDGSSFEAAQVIYRDQGYGSDPSVPLLKYVLTFDDDELLRTFGRSFQEFVAQCKQDDQSSSDSDVPELKELGYPTLSQMLAAHREMLARLLKDYLYFQLLDVLLSGNQRSAWRFAINEIIEVLDEGGGYALCGLGYKI